MKRLSGRWKLGLLVAAGAHLLFVLAGAAKVRLPSLGRLNQATGLYLAFSGAHYSWGFFAPNIGTEFKVDFRIRDKDGKASLEHLGDRGPNEVLLRETGIAATFWFGLHDEKIRRSLTASWAADVFSRHPEAKSVDVDVSAYYLPSQRQIRDGALPTWVPTYEATFERGSGDA